MWRDSRVTASAGRFTSRRLTIEPLMAERPTGVSTGADGHTVIITSGFPLIVTNQPESAYA